MADDLAANYQQSQQTAEIAPDRDKVPKPRYLPIVEALSQHYAVPFTAAAVEKNVPYDYESQHWHILPRLLEVAGLKSRFVKRRISAIDPMVLPCVCLRKDGSPILVNAISRVSKTVTFTDLGEGNFTQEESIRRFQNKIQREILLVTPVADNTASRMDADTLAEENPDENWFWRPIRHNRGAWFQIMLAALGINILGLALPIFVMNVYDRVIPNLAMVTLWTLALGVVIALLMDLILRVIRTNVLELAGRRIDLKIAAQLFQHATNIKLLDRRGGAAGIANQIREFESVREFFTSSSFVAVIDLLFIGIFVFVLWVIVGPIAIVPLLAVPVVVIIALLAQIPIGASIEKSQQLSSKRHLVLIESLLGIETVKSLNGEPVMQKEWENAVAATSRISGRTRFWSNFAISSTMVIQQSVSVVILVWGVYLVSSGRITVGGLIAANILAGRVLAPLGNICQTLVRAQHALKSLKSISEYMQLPVESPAGQRRDLNIRHGNIEFRDVSFTYPNAKLPALQNLNLILPAGQSCGVLGRVGSGKSTFGKMLIGLISPDQGLLLIDGYEIQHYHTAVVRNEIGYLPQDPELFTGSILENLLLGRPYASEDEINRALYFSGMDYFVAENPEGLHQFVGEKGNRLSGGQRQAISLARLLLRRPKVLFLDEPTNAMDNATEAVVIERLKELQKEGVGLLISTHRNSLAKIVDRLIILDQGKLVSDGPSELILAQLQGRKATRKASQ